MRNKVIAAIVTLGAAGSILAGPALSAVAAPAASAGVVAVSYSPNTHFYV